MSYINCISTYLELDRPYDVLATMKRGESLIDLAGVYRLISVLTPPVDEENSVAAQE